jgi:hypothetical protein
MLCEVSKRMVRVGDTFSSFLTVKDGFKLKEMRRESVTRRRKQIRIALGWPNLFRIIQYWKTVKISPRKKRAKVTHKGKTGARLI